MGLTRALLFCSLTLGCALTTLACGDDDPRDDEPADTSADLPHAPDDAPDAPDSDHDLDPDAATDMPMSCQPLSRASACVARCGPVPDGCDNIINCPQCPITRVELLVPAPDDAPVEIMLGGEPITLQARAIDASGVEAACDFSWRAERVDAPTQPALGAVIDMQGAPIYSALSVGEMTLTARCGELEVSQLVRHVAPRYEGNASALKLWVRPEIGLTLDAQGHVSAWQNQVVSQPTLIAMPALDGSQTTWAPQLADAARNGFPLLQFGGQAGLITTGQGSVQSFDLMDAMSLLVVLKTDVARPLISGLIAGGCGPELDGQFQVRVDSSERNQLVYFADQSLADPDFDLRRFNAIRLADELVLLGVHIDAMGLRVRLNGELAMSVEEPALGAQQRFVINRIGHWCTAPLALQGQLAEVMLLGSALDDADADARAYRERLERYLRTKYALP